MKSIITYILISVTSISFAQLTVRNANYIYSENVVLYVEDDVNIKESNSNLYLRDESQLIQGNGSTGNSGIGKLSIYQRGTVNNYSYNYWCSPVGNTDVDNIGNRNFRANNNIYDVTSTPITSSLASYTSGYDGSSSPLIISSRWLYSFSPGTAYSDWDHIAETGNLRPGYGFTMKGTSGSSSNQLYDFRGKPNTGDFRTIVLNGQWTLIGNPYPSAIDAAEFIHDAYNTGFTGSLYYWEQDPSPNSHYIFDYIGGYASYTTTAPDGSDNSVDSYTPATFTTFDGSGNIIPLPPPGATGSKTARRYIPVGQGFMIEGNTNGDIRIINDHRDFIKESDGSSFFFGAEDNNANSQRTYEDNGLNIVPEGYQRFRINVDFSDLYTRQLLMNLHDSATDGFDRGLEAKHPELISSDASWVLNNIPYTIQAFAYDEGLRIPLSLNLQDQQLIRFRIFDVQHFDEQPIYLHDRDTNLYINLREQDYEVSLESGNYNERFAITFINLSPLDIEDVSINDFDIFQNNNTSQLTIQNPNSINIKSISLFDTSGKRIFNSTLNTTESTYYFSTKNFSDGVYVATIRLKNDSTIQKKIIVKNK